MTPHRILVAGIGNIFFGDDGFGVAVVQRLATRPMPDGVVVMDVGIRGLDLTYALFGGYEAAILVDATERGGPPGTLYVLDPDEDPGTKVRSEPTLVDAHGMNPMQVLAFVRGEGAALGTLRIVGCEPAILGTADGEPVLGLSPAVEAAVTGAIELIEGLLLELTTSRIAPRALSPDEKVGHA